MNGNPDPVNVFRPPAILAVIPLCFITTESATIPMITNILSNL